MEALVSSEGLILQPVEGGCFRLAGENAEDVGSVSILLSEDELRWLVTTAGPAVLPRRETVR